MTSSARIPTQDSPRASIVRLASLTGSIRPAARCRSDVTSAIPNSPNAAIRTRTSRLGAGVAYANGDQAKDRIKAEARAERTAAVHGPPADDGRDGHAPAA